MTPSQSRRRLMSAGRQSAARFRALQRATFAAIVQPLGKHGRMAEVAPCGRPMKDVVAEFIKPNSRLTSLERIEIYNRQYWFRILDSMYDDYPGLRAILGEQAFMRLSTAYLAVHRLRNDIYYKRLTPDQYEVLSALSYGRTLEVACSRVYGGERGRSDARELQAWFQSWMELGWFCRGAAGA